MNPLASLIAQGGTDTFSVEQVLAEHPTSTELRLEALEAVRRGDWKRVVLFTRCAYRLGRGE